MIKVPIDDIKAISNYILDISGIYLIDRRTEKVSGLLLIPICIWSAACSTGQEVYSIAIVLKELLPDLKKYNIKLLGTDISDSAKGQASFCKNVAIYFNHEDRKKAGQNLR